MIEHNHSGAADVIKEVEVWLFTLVDKYDPLSLFRGIEKVGYM